eukprot:scaffold75355_cov24-Tisochrysis_lutea.AAC.1
MTGNIGQSTPLHLLLRLSGPVHLVHSHAVLQNARAHKQLLQQLAQSKLELLQRESRARREAEANTGAVAHPQKQQKQLAGGTCTLHALGEAGCRLSFVRIKWDVESTSYVKLLGQMAGFHKERVEGADDEIETMMVEEIVMRNSLILDAVLFRGIQRRACYDATANFIGQHT